MTVASKYLPVAAAAVDLAAEIARERLPSIIDAKGDRDMVSGEPRVFRTAELVVNHAASCWFRYSLWTSCGVR